jgi:hypothetical protein
LFIRLAALLDQLGGTAALLEGGALPPQLLSAPPLHHRAALLLLIYTKKFSRCRKVYKSSFSIFNVPTVMIRIQVGKKFSAIKYIVKIAC